MVLSVQQYGTVQKYSTVQQYSTVQWYGTVQRYIFQFKIDIVFSALYDSALLDVAKDLVESESLNTEDKQYM